MEDHVSIGITIGIFGFGSKFKNWVHVTVITLPMTSEIIYGYLQIMSPSLNPIESKLVYSS